MYRTSSRLGLSALLSLLVSVGCGGEGHSSLDDETLGTDQQSLLTLTYRTDFITAPSGVAVPDASDINDRGQVVGAVGNAANTDAYIWSRSAGLRTLERLPGAEGMLAAAVNERGMVAGDAVFASNLRRPVLWSTSGQLQDLGVYAPFVAPGFTVSTATANDLNDRGHVVGATTTAEHYEEAYLWEPTSGMKLLGTLGGTSSGAWAVNARDEVVGISTLPDGTSHAFLWARGAMQDLGALGGILSQASAINDLSEVTGTYATQAYETRVFRWTRARGMVDVGPTFADAGSGITSLATDNNILGQIVGGVQPPGLGTRAAVRQPLSGKWQDLMPDYPYDSFALATNNRAAIVGRVAAGAEFEGPFNAAIWTPRLSFSADLPEP
jgi:probable HAF family extracellular repeat protein